MKIFTFDEACRPAMASVMANIRAHPQWQAELRGGKTLGVLLYEGGFLAALSGTLGGQTRQEGTAALLPALCCRRHTRAHSLLYGTVV